MPKTPLGRRSCLQLLGFALAFGSVITAAEVKRRGGGQVADYPWMPFAGTAVPH